MQHSMRRCREAQGSCAVSGWVKVTQNLLLLRNTGCKQRCATLCCLKFKQCHPRVFFIVALGHAHARVGLREDSPAGAIELPALLADFIEPTNVAIIEQLPWMGIFWQRHDFIEVIEESRLNQVILSSNGKIALQYVRKVSRKHPPDVAKPALVRLHSFSGMKQVPKDEECHPFVVTLGGITDQQNKTGRVKPIKIEFQQAFAI
jgi:hypothetical protein